MLFVFWQEKNDAFYEQVINLNRLVVNRLCVLQSLILLSCASLVQFGIGYQHLSKSTILK